ncbi:MAG: helix-turn-helix domain-containing protein [Pseudonocardia sp.]
MPVWDIARRPPGEQFGYWREVICQAFVPLDPAPNAETPDFASRVETRQLGAVNRAEIRSRRQRTAHGPREVRRGEAAYYFVNLQLAGRCRVRQGRAESVVEPGGFTVVDTTEPYWFDFPQDWRMLSFRVPHATLAARLPDPLHGTGRAIGGAGGLGGVVTSLMRALWELDEPAGAVELEESLASVVALALGGVADAAPAPRAATRAAVLRHVAAHLGDPRLSVGSVCRRFAISSRQLHRLFADQERSFAATVRAMRLERCARLIADPATTASITEIGARHGFADPASFSRAFRRHFGTPPREVRQARKVADGS